MACPLTPKPRAGRRTALRHRIHVYYSLLRGGFGGTENPYREGLDALLFYVREEISTYLYGHLPSVQPS